jgi:thiamine transport system permease protein
MRSVTRLEPNRGERGEIATGLTLAYYRELFINRRDSLFYVPPIEAGRNSLAYAGATVGLSLALGLPAALALSRRSKHNRWLDPLLMLPMGASAVTLGLGFVIVFNHPPLDIRSFPLIIPIAHSLVALPLVIRTLMPALASIPLILREAAAILGASPWRVWREVELPIISRAVLVSAVFAFTISFGEFGATSFLARPEYPTLPVAIFRYLALPGALNYGQALAMATLLMVVCAAGILLIDKSA